MGIKNTIIFDIDETLVENEAFPEYLNLIKERILFLKKNNYTFGICTNRPIEEFVHKVIDYYLIDDYIICEGGAIIFNKDNYSYIIKVKENVNKIIRRKLDMFDIRYTLNNKRKRSSTITILDENITDYLFKYLKSLDLLNDFHIERSGNKILIYSKKIDKIKIINELFQDRNVVFITDYEKHMSKNNTNVKIYSVGSNINFNKKCDLVFNKSTKGILEILKKEGEKYEQI